MGFLFTLTDSFVSFTGVTFRGLSSALITSAPASIFIDCAFVDSVPSVRSISLIESGWVTLNGCRFENITGTYASIAKAAKLNIIDCQFTNNLLDTSEANLIRATNLTMVNSTFDNNFVAAQGNLIGSSNPVNFIIKSVEIQNTTAAAIVANWGIVFGGEVTISDCLIANSSGTVVFPNFYPHVVP